MGLAETIKSTSAYDLQDLTAFIVSECEMVTQDTDGKMIDIDNDDVVRAMQAWAYMNLTQAQQGD